VDAEVDACLIVAITANVLSQADALLLSSCIRSVYEQTKLLHGIFLSLFVATDELDATVSAQLANFDVNIMKTSRRAERFEHLSCLKTPFAEAPSHAWVLFLQLDNLLHPQCAASLLPSIRRAAVDQRIIAMSFKRQAVARAADVQVLSAEDVDASLEAGTALRLEGDAVTNVGLANYAVKIQNVRSFLESTPNGMLSHPLCDDRFLYKIGHTYGTKVHSLSLPADSAAWLCWSPSTQQGAERSVNLLDSDKEIGKELYEGMQTNNKFESVDAAIHAIAKLRRAVERRMVQWVGESASAKELKLIANEEAASILEEFGLGDVIGSQRWMREVAKNIAESVGKEFAVVVSAE
jgi:hypothetical protein